MAWTVSKTSSRWLRPAGLALCPWSFGSAGGSRRPHSSARDRPGSHQRRSECCKAAQRFCAGSWMPRSLRRPLGVACVGDEEPPVFSPGPTAACLKCVRRGALVFGLCLRAGISHPPHWDLWFFGSRSPQNPALHRCSWRKAIKVVKHWRIPTLQFIFFHRFF